MKNKSLIVISLAAGVALAGCKKDNLEAGGDMTSDIAAIGPMVTVNSSDYERVEAVALERADEYSPYTAGKLEYVENGQVTATLDFSKDKATCTDKYGDKKDIELEKDEYEDKDKWVDKDKKGKGKDKDEWGYKKVITEPLVKAEDCDYIVAGEIKLFDIKTGEWVATFDYGDGTCDDLIDKHTKDGADTFSMREYPEWGGKK